mgnify:CR=1 FL=1
MFRSSGGGAVGAFSARAAAAAAAFNATGSSGFISKRFAAAFSLALHPPIHGRGGRGDAACGRDGDAFGDDSHDDDVGVVVEADDRGGGATRFGVAGGVRRGSFDAIVAVPHSILRSAAAPGVGVGAATVGFGFDARGCATTRIAVRLGVDDSRGDALNASRGGVGVAAAGAGAGAPPVVFEIVLGCAATTTRRIAFSTSSALRDGDHDRASFAGLPLRPRLAGFTNTGALPGTK